jgi:alanine racemase
MHPSFVITTEQTEIARRRSWTEFSATAVRRNLEVAQTLAGPTVGIMAVVKADGYGHGACRMAQACAGRVHSFGVACVGEATSLRLGGVREPIYILGPVLPQEMEAVLAGGFRPVISTLEEGQAWAESASRAGVVLPVVWALDTGMGRIGTLPDEVDVLAGAWSGWSHLHLDSIASHFPSADEDAEYTMDQSRRFHEEVEDLRLRGVVPDYVQLNNSAGILRYATAPEELVRAGLMLYGVSPFPDQQGKLESVLTWKTKVTLVRELPAGWGVNYGRTFITPERMLVATLAVGYADGYMRALSNQGADVLIQGQRCPVLGRVTMDQIVVGVGHLATAPMAGEEAVLLGRQGQEEISAAELAGKAGTIAWEIFTSIKAC